MQSQGLVYDCVQDGRLADWTYPAALRLRFLSDSALPGGML
jgi:hypothetical protein